VCCDPTRVPGVQWRAKAAQVVLVFGWLSRLRALLPPIYVVK